MSEHDGTLFVKELLSLEPPGEVILHHPFAAGSVGGESAVLEAMRLSARPLSYVEQTGMFAEGEIRACTWRADHRGKTVRGVTALTKAPDAIQVRVMVSSVPTTATWRDEVMRASRGDIAIDGWEVPDRDKEPAPVAPEELDAKLPFEVTPDVVFHSPVLARPVEGESAVRRVIAYASSIYGTREYGPKILVGGTMLSFWKGTVAEHPIEVANVISLAADRRVRAMYMAMRPWPVLKLFHDVARARTEHFLEPSFFELAAG